MIESEEEGRSFVERLTSPAAMVMLDSYVAMLRVEAEKQNLVAKTSLAQVWTRHIADSAQLLNFVPRETSQWLDLGSGAGLPGLMIAMISPDRPIVLVESRRKRIDWLQHCVAEFGLQSCRVEGRRLELVETFESGIISARAFAPLPKLLDLSARFSTHETIWLLPKGRSTRQEWEALKPKRRKMFHVEQSITDADAGILVGKGRIAS